MDRLVTLTLTAALAGCGVLADPNASFWAKEGASMADLRRSEARCRQDAGRHANVLAYGGRPELNAALRQNSPHVMCMQVQEGWTLLRSPVVLPAGT